MLDHIKTAIQSVREAQAHDACTPDLYQQLDNVYYDLKDIEEHLAPAT